MDPGQDDAGFRIDKVWFGGGLAGALMAFAAIGTLLSGLPELRWLVLPPVLLGAVYGVARVWLRHR
jgi:hypothetical protein